MLITPKIVSVVPRVDYTLALVYENGEQRIFDVTPLLKYPVYQPLRDLNYFQKVRPCSRTVTWPGEEDIAPENLLEVPWNLRACC